MAQLGTLSIDFLVNLQNSLNQVGQLENRIAELERAARESRREIDRIGDSRVGNIAGAFDDATDGINRFRGGLQGVLSGGGGIGDLIGAFKGIPPQALLAAGSVIAITGAVVGLGFAIKSSLSSLVQQGDELDKTSQKLGVNVEALQGLRFAAQMSGMEADKLNDAFKEINMTLGDDAESEKAKLFNELGVSLKNAAGQAKTADEILIDSADAFAKLGSDTERSILAMKLFGEEGKEMVPLLKQGSEALREQINEHKELGGVISKETTKQAAAFNDSLTKLNVVLESGKKALGEAFLPSAMLVVDVILELAKSIKSMLPEGKSFQQIILDVTKGGLRLLLQAVDATIKQINNFGRILVVAAPLIAQVGLNITLVANAASILVNALDILQGFIRVSVLTVLDAMVQGLENVAGGMAAVARAAGLDDLASKLSTAESSLRGMSSALAGLSADAMAGIRTDTQDIAVDIQDATNALKNYGKTIDGIQSFGNDLTKIQSPTAGAYKALEDKIGGLTDAVDKNTEATDKGTKTTAEGNKGAKGAGGARESAMPKPSALEAFIKPIDPKLYEADPKYKKLIDDANADLANLSKQRAAEQERGQKIDKDINSTQASISSINARLESSAQYRENLQKEQNRQGKALTDNEYRQNALNEEAYKQRKANEDKLKKADEAFLKSRQDAYDVFETIGNIPGAGPAAAALKELFDIVNIARDAAYESQIGILHGGKGPGGAIIQTPPRGKDIISKAEEQLQKDAEAAAQAEQQSGKNIQNNQEALVYLKELETQATKEDNALLDEKFKKLKQLSDKQVESQQSLLNINIQVAQLEVAKAKAKADEANYLAKIKMLQEADLTLLYIANDIIHENNALIRAKLQLNESDFRFKIAMQQLDEQGLEGNALLIEQQKLRNEYDAEQVDLKARIADEEGRAAEKARETLVATMQRAAELAHNNEIAGREIEILNTKNATERIALEFALERLKLSIETLTPLQMELELLKLKLEYEEALTAEKVKQVEMTGQAIGGVGSIGGQFAGMMEKLGFSKETARVVDEISSGLGGVATGVGGVARLMAGDIVGGITGIVSGALSTFESIWDIFNPEEEETEKLDLTPLQPDADTLRQQAEEFAKAFVDEQERRLQRPIQITVDARGALVGDDAEVARALGNLLEGEMGRRIGNINVPRGF